MTMSGCAHSQGWGQQAGVSLAHLWSPGWLGWLAPTPTAHARGAPPPEPVRRERGSVAVPAAAPPWQPRPPAPPSTTPQPPQAVPVQPARGLSPELTPKAPAPLPGPRLSAQAVVPWALALIFVQLCLCFALWSTAVLFSEALRLPSVPGIPQSGGPPGRRFLSAFTAPSQECSSCPESFFSLLSPFFLVLPRYVEIFLPVLKV